FRITKNWSIITAIAGGEGKRKRVGMSSLDLNSVDLDRQGSQSAGSSYKTSRMQATSPKPVAQAEADQKPASGNGTVPRKPLQPKLTQQQLETHLWGAANILRGKTAGQDYKNYILSLMFYKRLCDQWECEADEAIAELERQQSRAFSDKEKAVFRKRGEHRFRIPDGARWGDVKAVSTNLG